MQYKAPRFTTNVSGFFKICVWGYQKVIVTRHVNHAREGYQKITITRRVNHIRGVNILAPLDEKLHYISGETSNFILSILCIYLYPI